METFEFVVRFQYRLLFTEKVFDPENPVLRNLILNHSKMGSSPRMICFLDAGLDRSLPKLRDQIQHYLASISETYHESTGRLILIPGGEQAKNDRDLFDQIVQQIHDARICRHSYVIVIGGGSVIDTVCFAASIVHRGVRQIRIPSTVLAQGDAGIGVKNGINFFNKKNFLGTFDPPYAVINDADLLTSLDQKSWISGIAEAVKVSLIRDPKFFHWISSHVDSLVNRRDLSFMAMLIRKSAELHLRHITTSGDPFEKGSSRPLDFGHWVAHKIEQLSNYQISHGHAVAMGMAVDTVYSNRKKFLKEVEKYQILKCLRDIGFDYWSPLLLQVNSITGRLIVFEGLDEFREHLGGELTITVLRGIGVSFEVHEIDETVVLEAIHELRRTFIRSSETALLL